MGEGEPIGYEERRAVALETGFPRHFAPGGAISASDAERGVLVTVVRTCVGRFPAVVDQIAGHGLVSQCPSCDQSFVWTDRTQSWTAT